MDKKLTKHRWRVSAVLALCRRRLLLLFLLAPVTLLLWLHSPQGWLLSFKEVDDAESKYLINTPTCQIPVVNPFDPTLLKFITPPEPVECNKGPLPLTYSDMDSVHLIPERVPLYLARTPAASVSCCTNDISWGKFKTPRRYINFRKTVYSPVCQPLTGSYTPKTADGVAVACFSNGTLVYEAYYHFIKLRPQLEAQSAKRSPQHVRISVLIFMFDSLSRLQFLRWFPRSRRFLNERMEAYELGGFNKIGDNTWPNIVPMLTGMHMGEMEKTCAPDLEVDPLDSCPFMWHEFKNAGYRTALGEDAVLIGTFDYWKQGFYTQPTDYYSNPTTKVAEIRISHKRVYATYLCQGSHKTYELMFKYAQDLATRLADRPYWAFIDHMSYTHDLFNLPYFLDEPYFVMLEKLFNSGALNNTVLVTMGDHGLRWGAARQTFIGGLEERLPLMSLYFPHWFRRRYPAAFENLRINQQRLTSFADIHATLLDLLRPDETLGMADAREAPVNASSVTLFRRVSPLRRCVHVGIPEHFCTCSSSEAISPDDQRAKIAAKLVLQDVNEHLSAAPQCALLQLHRILMARISWRSDEKSKKSNSSRLHRHMTTIQIETQPGGARLEGTIIDDVSLSGSVSRLNRYGNLIWCINHHVLEKYCHCIDKTKLRSVNTTRANAPSLRSRNEMMTTDDMLKHQMDLITSRFVPHQGGQRRTDHNPG